MVRDGAAAGMSDSELWSQETHRTDRHTSSAACVCLSSTERQESSWQCGSCHCACDLGDDVHLQQISSKSVNPLQKYHNFSIFVAAAILSLFKFSIFIGLCCVGSQVARM